MTLNSRPRVLYFGMYGQLSYAPLAGLVGAGLDVCAVVVPPTGPPVAGPQPAWRRLEPPLRSPVRSALPLLLGRTVVDLAWERRIPVLEARQLRSASLRAALAELRPDLLAVSCFPSVIPRSVLALPRAGAINLHPSPLPHSRGPAPLFWAFRERLAHDGDQWGITVHLLDSGLDAGPIVAQEALTLHDGMTQRELDLIVAARGAALLVRAAADLLDSRVAPRPQDEAAATYHPWPGADDFIVHTERPARWAFNFIRGTAGWGHPHLLIAGERRWVVRSALGYDPVGSLDAPVVEEGTVLRVRCTPGVLTVAATPLG